MGLLNGQNLLKTVSNLLDLIRIWSSESERYSSNSSDYTSTYFETQGALKIALRSRVDGGKHRVLSPPLFALSVLRILHAENGCLISTLFEKNPQHSKFESDFLNQESHFQICYVLGEFRESFYQEITRKTSQNFLKSKN